VRQVWHIFKKDARRLRWETAATLGLLAWVAHLDRWRSDWAPGLAEGWLNVLVPLAWAYLVGLLILQDALVGDREFWLALPCRRRSMPGAKALFVLCFIHLPYLLAQAGILAARGFSPVTYFPHLMWKQLLLLVALTLPAAAVAAMVENVVQFALAAVVLAAGWIYLNGNVAPLSAQPWILTDTARSGLALLAVVLGAGTILRLQYGRRRTAVSRGIGASAAIAAAAAFVWLPSNTSAAIDCTLEPAKLMGPVRVTLGEKAETLPDRFRRSYRTSTVADIALPIEVSGLPQADLVRFAQLSLAIRTPGGEQYEAQLLTRSTRLEQIQVQASVWPVEAPTYQVVTLDRAVYERIKDAPVSIEGKILAEFHRRGTAARIPVEKPGDAPGLGKCTSAVTGGGVFQTAGVNVECESPDEIPNPTYVTLKAPELDPPWHTGLGGFGRGTSYPRSTWLSPLNRRNAYINLFAKEDWVKGMNGAPLEDLAGAVLEIVPAPVTGRAILEYQWIGVTLSKFVVAPVR
jgi:hypothetical protein